MVIPSIRPEGCPTSILESMSYKIPVIGYDVEGVNELIINDFTGFIIPLLNEKIMAEKIIKLLENPYLMEKYGNNGYNVVKEKFSLNKNVTKAQSLF